MKTFWLKVAGFAVVVLVLIILATVFLPSKPPRIEEPESQRQPQEAEPQAEEVSNPKVDYVAKINELDKAGRDESLNAAPFYQKAVELYVEMPQEVEKFARQPWPADLSAKQQLLLKEWVQSNSQALSELERGTRRPCFWLQRSSKDGTVIRTLMPELRDFRGLCSAVRGRAKLAAAEGNIDQAVGDIVTCYRFGSHVSDSPILIEQLVGIAIRAIALDTTFEILDRAKAAEAWMGSLQSRIEQLSIDESFIPDMRAEKFMLLDIIQRVFTDDGKGNGRIDMESANSMLSEGTTESEEVIRSLQKHSRRETTEAVEKLFEYYEFLIRKTPWQRRNENVEARKEIEKITKDNVLIGILCPAYVRVAEVFARCRAHTDALITTLALLRYKADKGQFPEKLDELVSASYLKALPSDPFGGGPLVYKQLGEDFILYSCGQDCDDDGGTRSKWGGEQAGDQVFWPVAQNSG
jgi:Na+-transporting methylmalonyl-CoA/oxaloacetate decarboxylase gamma subunit